MKKTLDYIVKNYNLMPLGLKIIAWLYWSGIMQILNRNIQQDFDPTPLFGVLIPFGVWNVYIVILSTYSLLVLFRHSYSWIKRFVYLQYLILIIHVLDLMHGIISLNDERNVTRIIMIILFVVICVFMNTYLLKQKKYFNKK